MATRESIDGLIAAFPTSGIYHEIIEQSLRRILERADSPITRAHLQAIANLPAAPYEVIWLGDNPDPHVDARTYYPKHLCELAAQRRGTLERPNE